MQIALDEKKSESNHPTDNNKAIKTTILNVILNLNLKWRRGEDMMANTFVWSVAKVDNNEQTHTQSEIFFGSKVSCICQCLSLPTLAFFQNLIVHSHQQQQQL